MDVRSMSQSIIEKVAIAIGGLWNDCCNPCTPDKIIKCEECLNAAKAAIEAMLNPPKELSNGVMQASLDCTPIYRCEEQALKVWNNTINAILDDDYLE